MSPAEIRFTNNRRPPGTPPGTCLNSANVVSDAVFGMVATGQEVIGRTAKANEQIGEIAKSQFESAARNTQANVEQATRAATEKAESFARGATKASKAK